MYYNWRQYRARVACRALVTDNRGKDPIPVEVLERWLNYIEEVSAPEGCAGCGERPCGVGKGGCEWACARPKPALPDKP